MQMHKIATWGASLLMICRSAPAAASSPGVRNLPAGTALPSYIEIRALKLDSPFIIQKYHIRSFDSRLLHKPDVIIGLHRFRTWYNPFCFPEHLNVKRCHAGMYKTSQAESLNVSRKNYFLLGCTTLSRIWIYNFIEIFLPLGMKKLFIFSFRPFGSRQPFHHNHFSFNIFCHLVCNVLSIFCIN